MSIERRYKTAPMAGYKGSRRFCIVSTETGEVLDDAQGYGYKTAQAAYAGYGYKSNPKRKEIDLAIKNDRKIVAAWAKENKGFVKGCERIAFEIMKGSWGPDDKFDAKMLSDLAKNSDVKLPLSAGRTLKYLWD